jgi:hypothetical protein
MARTVKRTDLNLKNIKPINPNSKTGKVMATANFLMPKNALDVATLVFPYGKAARATAGIAKKGSKYIAKVYRNIGK